MSDWDDDNDDNDNREEIDFDYDPYSTKDWSKDLDDLDASYWEKYYGGPGEIYIPGYEIIEAEEIDRRGSIGPDYSEDYEHDYTDKISELAEDAKRTVEKASQAKQNLLNKYLKIGQEIDDLTETYNELADKISKLIKDNEKIKEEGFLIEVKYSPKWQFSDDLKELIKKVEIGKNQEIESGIAKLINNTRYIARKMLPSKVQERYPRAFMPWSKEEDKALLYLYRGRVSFSEISKIHRRKRSALMARLNKLLQKEEKYNRDK